MAEEREAWAPLARVSEDRWMEGRMDGSLYTPTCIKAPNQVFQNGLFKLMQSLLRDMLVFYSPSTLE